MSPDRIYRTGKRAGCPDADRMRILAGKGRPLFARKAGRGCRACGIARTGQERGGKR